MKYRFILIFSILALNLFGQTKVVELTECLKKNSCDPKEYVLNLFKTNDIIIIGERNRNDTTQYDLLLEILSDKRFIEEVGHVYTEVGCENRTEWTNTVLKASYDTKAEFEKNLIRLYRELDCNPLWEKYNLYKYLKGIYNINKNLDEKKKITIGLTDLAFDWGGMNRKKYQAFENISYARYRSRDSIMAVNFIGQYEKQEPINGKRKALLIQSFPHAINMNLLPNGVKYKSTGSYVVEKYRDNVKIVAFNSMYFGRYNSSDYSLVDDGRWDAAFKLTSCEPVGFDVAETPFGETEFEEAYGVSKKYQEIVDGIIFYEPFYEFRLTIGIPNVVDNEFSKELVKRFAITEASFFNRLGLRLLKFHFKKIYKNYYNNVRSFKRSKEEGLIEQMNKWIEK